VKNKSGGILNGLSLGSRPVHMSNLMNTFLNLKKKSDAFHTMNVVVVYFIHSIIAIQYNIILYNM